MLTCSPEVLGSAGLYRRVSDLTDDPKSLEPVSDSLREILRNVVSLFSSLQELIVTALGGNSKDTTDFVMQITNLVSDAIDSILSNLADSAGSIPVLGEVIKALNDQLNPTVKKVLSLVQGALSSPNPVGLGLGAVVPQVVTLIEKLLSDTVQPIVNSILPSGSTACGKTESPPSSDGGGGLDVLGLLTGLLGGVLNGVGSLLGGGGSSVINELGSMVSSPAKDNIEELLMSLAKGINPSISSEPPENSTKVIRPNPEQICVSLNGTRPSLVAALNGSLGLPLLNIALVSRRSISALQFSRITFFEAQAMLSSCSLTALFSNLAETEFKSLRQSECDIWQKGPPGS